MPRYVAFLRAISNQPMQPFRDALTGLGFDDVESFGVSGNLIFSTGRSGRRAIEKSISARMKTPAILRTRTELARVMASDPFGAAILLLATMVPAKRRRAFEQLDFEDPRPVLDARTVFFMHPTRLRGSRATFDLEKFLGVTGTTRSARVVRSVLTRMKGAG
jgi:uncharacterized protein (DUF1697 family)